MLHISNIIATFVQYIERYDKIFKIKMDGADTEETVSAGW